MPTPKHILALLLGAVLAALLLAVWAAYDEMYRSTRGWPSRVLWEEE